MISEEIIKIASNTSNVGLKKKYSHKISLKNSICGDKITLGIIANKKKITSMNYETESCVYCEASASLLSRKIKNFQYCVMNITNMRTLFRTKFLYMFREVAKSPFLMHPILYSYKYHFIF